MSFIETLRIQRWDDHRYYHHSRINQSLHLISALSFLTAYAVFFFDPILAALIGWLIGMSTRQCGHFFFEPAGYDHVNAASHEHKEAIKVGYNLRRKLWLIAIWAAAPVLLATDPRLWGTLPDAIVTQGYVRSVGAVWLLVGIGGLIFRAVQLLATHGWKTALAWVGKILTDPFHDVSLYWGSPACLLRGELFDPGHGKKRD